MGDIYADGGASGYPVSLDTATTQTDTTAPLAFGPKVARALKLNNLAAAVIALETELGTAPSDAADDTVTPADSASTVKAKLNMVLYVLKAIIGGAGWKSTPPGTLTSIKTTADAAFVSPSSPAAGDLIRRNSGNSQWERFAAGAAGKVLTMGAAVPDWALLMLHGNCQLTKSGANLLLSPKDGNTLVINSKLETIPDAGVTLAPTSATPDTTYFIYAYMSGATMTLEYSTTAYAVQAGTGITIKSADATRTLVGMARAITGPAWVDSVTQQFMLSYFNRQAKVGFNGFTANRTTTSTGAWVELNSEIRVEFLVWSGEDITVHIGGLCTHSATSGAVSTSIGFDGTTPEDVACSTQSTTAAFWMAPVISLPKTGLSEGYHYATILAKLGNAGTGTWLGGAGIIRVTLRTRIMG